MFLDEEGRQTGGFIKDSELTWGHILSFADNRVAHVCKALQLDTFAQQGISKRLKSYIDGFSGNEKADSTDMKFIYKKAEQQIITLLDDFAKSPAIGQYKRVYFTTEEFLERSYFKDDNSDSGRQEINEQVMYQFCIFLIKNPGEYERAALHALKNLHLTYEHCYNEELKKQDTAK